jgi:hypothetical protein
MSYFRKILTGTAFELDRNAGATSPRLFWAALAGITLIAAVLRFWNLSAVPVWQDEAVTHAFAQLDLWTLLTKDIDNHPPLSYIVQHFWHKINPDLAAARVPVAVAGTASVAVFMLFLRDSVNTRAALIGGLFLALSTSHIFYSQDARMYAYAVLGLIIALWGAVGFAEPGRHRPSTYAALYIAGGAIAIYSHMIGLIVMACFGGASLAALIFRSPSDWFASSRRWIVMNLMLLVIVLSWLVRLPSASESFLGLWDTNEGMARWYYLNIIGFPGIDGFGKLAEIVVFLLACASIPLCWGSGRKVLALAIGGLLLAYPLLIIELSALSAEPLLSNRVFSPIVIASVTGLAIAVSMIRILPVRAAALSVCAVAASLSAWNAAQYSVKPDDFKAAFDYADAQGYEGAPVFTCNVFCSASAWENRPDATIYDFRLGDLMRYRGPQFWAVTKNGMHWEHQATIADLDAYLGGGWQVPGGIPEALAGQSKAIVMVTTCGSALDDEQRLTQALADAGFRPAVQEQRMLSRSQGRTIMVGPETRVILFERQPPASEAIAYAPKP